MESTTPLGLVTLRITPPLFAVFALVSERWKTEVSDIDFPIRKKIKEKSA